MSKRTREELQALIEQMDKTANARQVLNGEGYFTMDERVDALEHLIKVGEVELD